MQACLMRYIESQGWENALCADLACDSIAGYIAQLPQRTRKHSREWVTMIHAQSNMHDLSYLFSPIILSLLGKTCHYLSQQTQLHEQVYRPFFNLAALKVAGQHALSEMQLYLDIDEAKHNADYFEVLAVFKALANSAQTQLLILDAIWPHWRPWLHSMGRNVVEIKTEKNNVHLAEINWQRLFSKHKTQAEADICQQIIVHNCNALTPLNVLKAADLARLIEDFMYSEQLLEKLSVYAEFSDTIFKNQQ